MRSALASIPATLDACLVRIREWATANDWRPARLAREAGIAENVTRDMFAGTWSPTASSIRKLEAVIPSGWQPGDPLPSTPKSTRAA